MPTEGLSVDAFSVFPIKRLDVGFGPRPWRFADERRGEIDAYFADRQRRNPALWNGRVLMMGDFVVNDGIFRGACFDVDYASFISWQDWDFPDKSVHDCFAMVDRVDFERSVARELKEETGLDVAEFTADPGWYTVLGGVQVAQMKLLRSRETAATLRARILDHLAREDVPELADIRIVRREGDLDPAMPPFVTSYIRHIWSRST
jgi:8-oxo-dGTP pyrophosphatase MutT (NUDIX family)